ncbi:MAG: phage portal protein [Devosia sp.]
MPARNPLVRLFPFLDRKSWSVVEPDFPLSIFGGGLTISGTTVTPESAMRVAPFSAAVRLISEAAGITPAKVFSRDPKAPAPDHAAYALVHEFANEWTSAPALREAVTADAILHGHGYAHAIRVNGKVQELHRIEQRTTPVQRKFHERTAEPFYVVGSGADAFTVPFTDMIHIAGFRDMAQTDAGREAIGLSALLERHTSKFFAKGARPSAVVAFTDKMPPETLSRIQTAWNEAHNGDNAGGTVFIDGTGGGSFSTVTPSAQSSELTQQRQFQIDEIARHTGVPPTMLFGLDRATWSNVEQLALQFRQFALRPWLRRWEDAYALVLLTPEERASFYVEFILDDLASADLATQTTAFNQLRASGVMTANEVRAIRNLPAHATGDVLANPYTTTTTVTTAPSP